MVFNIKRTVEFDDEGNKVLSELRANVDDIRVAVLELFENSNRYQPTEVRARIEKIYRAFEESKDMVDSLKKIGDDLPE